MLAGPGEDEINVINEFVSQHDMHYKSINFGEDLIKEMIMSSIFGIPMSANTAMSAYRLMVQRVTRVSKHYNDFQSLSVKVQGILLKHNADLVVSLRGASFFQMKTGLYGKKEGFFKRRKRYIIDSERCFKGRQGYI